MGERGALDRTLGPGAHPGTPEGDRENPGEGQKVPSVTRKSPMFKIQDGGCIYGLAGSAML